MVVLLTSMISSKGMGLVSSEHYGGAHVIRYGNFHLGKYEWCEIQSRYLYPAGLMNGGAVLWIVNQQAS